MIIINYEFGNLNTQTKIILTKQNSFTSTIPSYKK